MIKVYPLKEHQKSFINIVSYLFNKGRSMPTQYIILKLRPKLLA